MAAAGTAAPLRRAALALALMLALQLLATCAASATPASQLPSTSSNSSSPHAAPHKPLAPVSAADVVLLVLSFVILALAAGAGIGGGVLLVPLLSLLGGFGPVQTVALSNVTILAGAVTNAAFNVPRKRPGRPGPIIDYDLLLLLAPPIIIGSVGGSFLNMLVPGWVTKALVVVVLLPMMWRMVGKARILWAAESHRKHSMLLPPKAAQPGDDDDDDPAGCRSGADADASLRGARAHAPRSPGCDKDTVRLPQLPPSWRGAGKDAEAGDEDSEPESPLARRSKSMPWGSRSQQQPAQAAGAGLRYAPSLLRTLSMDNTRALVRAASTQLRQSVSEALSSQRSSLGELLGPELCLLTTRESAEATVAAQALSRAATLQRAGTLERGDSFAAAMGSFSRRHGGVVPVLECTADGGAGPDALPEGHSVCGPPGHVVSPFELHQAQRAAAAEHGQHGHAHKAAGQAQQDELPRGAKASCHTLDHSGCAHTPELDAHMHHRIERERTTQLPAVHIGLLLLLLVAVVVTAACGQLLSCGSWQYWVCVLSPLPLMLVAWAAARRHVLWRAGWQAHLRLECSQDIHWTTLNTLLIPAGCISVGIVAGLLGLGGGVVLAPLLLELGVQPAVSAASSQAALLISSASASIIYMVNGSLPADYGAAMALIGLTGTLCGQLVINYIVQRTGRSSILVLTLAALFVAASCAAVAALALALAAVARNPSTLGASSAREVCRLRGSGGHS